MGNRPGAALERAEGGAAAFVNVDNSGLRLWIAAAFVVGLAFLKVIVSMAASAARRPRAQPPAHRKQTAGGQ